MSDATHSPYNYFPSKDSAIAFLTLFSISTLVHTAQAIYYRTYYLLPTAALCGIIEIMGWSGRLWSSISPFLEIPFQIQICCTIIAPTPLLAANFVIFGNIIRRLGPQYSRLTPKRYTIILCTCDMISLVIQGLGGGLAATANNPPGAKRGGNVMLGGIVFQLAVIISFSFLFVEYLIRYIKRSAIKQSSTLTSGNTGNGGTLVRGELTKRLVLMLAAIGFVTVLLFIRAIYRTIELADGWKGRIISTQVYFNVLDGGMIIFAIFAYNFFHPGFLLALPNDGVAEKQRTSLESDVNGR